MDRQLREAPRGRFGDRLRDPSASATTRPRSASAPADLIDVMRALHDDPQLGFEILADLAGVDTGDHMQVVYHLWSAQTPDWLRVVADGMPRETRASPR